MYSLRRAALAASVALSVTLPASSRSEDPCAKVAGKLYAPPGDALACLKSFAFNETLKQNVMSVVSTVFDFYTFENYYLDSPPPFQESTKNIRAELARINSTKYEVSCVMLSVCSFCSDRGCRRTSTSTRICLTRQIHLMTVTQV